jgi:2-amino-4-hydroxy-6-hydroxymethyldihydropteridine diphosphokinase
LILNDSLKIPHPLLHQRRFTLAPLAEIAPDFVHPVLQQTMSDLLADCIDTGVVEKL